MKLFIEITQVYNKTLKISVPEAREYDLFIFNKIRRVQILLRDLLYVSARFDKPIAGAELANQILGFTVVNMCIAK